MDLHQFEDYRDVLKALIDDKRRFLKSYTYQGLALACRVQKAYVSRVLKKAADLNQDQLYLACQYLGLTAEERHYITKLQDYNRSALTPRREELAAELEALRRDSMRTERHLVTRSVDAESDSRHAAYFLDPDAQIVHMYLTIEAYRSNPDRIRVATGLSQQRFDALLGTLAALDLIDLKGRVIRVLRESLHLPQNSSLFSPYCTQMRARTLAKLQGPGSDNDTHISIMYSADAKAQKAVHAEFIAFLKVMESIVTKAPAEEVFQMNADLFSWMATK